VKLMENMRHIEKALVKLGVNQCRNCSDILPYSALGIGGICQTCWIEDEEVIDYDFSEISQHEILRHLRKLPLFSDMARRDAAILKAEPGHRFALDHRFLLRESYAAALPRTTKDDDSPYRWSTKQGVYLAEAQQ
jgi:hypothetical protein